LDPTPGIFEDIQADFIQVNGKEPLSLPPLQLAMVLEALLGASL
jgi:hypothetical protein